MDTLSITIGFSYTNYLQLSGQIFVIKCHFVIQNNYIITNIWTAHLFSSTYWNAYGIPWLEEIQIGLLRNVSINIDKNNWYLLLIIVDNVRISTTHTVEIFEQEWKTICGFTNWNVNNSLVVCRQLNLSTCVYKSI